jgi:hypothetical protein
VDIAIAAVACGSLVWCHLILSLSFKECRPFVVTGKYLSGVWLGDGLRTDTKGHMFKRDWTSCLKFVNHSNWGGIYDHLMSVRIFTAIMNKMFMKFRNYKANGYGHNLESAVISH